MIQDENLRRLFKMQKSISIIGKDLNENGLQITYAVKGDLMDAIDVKPADACQLLKDAGLITEYTKDTNGNFYLTWEAEENTQLNGEHIQKCETVFGSFEDFVEQTRFTYFDAQTIAALFELNKIPENQNTLL